MLGLRRRLAERLVGAPGPPAADIDRVASEFGVLSEQVAPYTLTPKESRYALYGAVCHIVETGVPGDVVECGVWRGGSAMLAALTLLELGETDRTIWLYDTYAGMPPDPSDLDVNRFGVSAREMLDSRERIAGAKNVWVYATLEDVRANMESTGYPNVRYIEGKIEDTIPAQTPERISLLRLDTDWYRSTRHELEHLWPLLEPGGVFILDDYGWWDGARRAVDEFGLGELLIRVGDEGCRIATKH